MRFKQIIGAYSCDSFTSFSIYENKKAGADQSALSAVGSSSIILVFFIYEPRPEKTVFLHMRKQRRRSASR